MTPIAFAVCAAALWATSCCGQAAGAGLSASATAAAATAEGPTLSEMSQFLEPLGQLFETASNDVDQFEGRKKKPKPMQIAMGMAGVAAGSMMMMKAMGAIKLFIIHSFFATKLGLILAAYLLLCKMMEMKQMPKKTVKWVSPPLHFDEHPSPSAMSPYGDPQPQSYEPHPDPMQQQPQQQQQPPAEQYGPPQQQPQFMPTGDFGGGGGDMQAHYSHVSPVTYRPMINRNQPDAMIKSGRMH